MNDIEICYVAALAEGLRLINEKALDRGVNLDKFNADALVHFVRAKGDRLVELYLTDPKSVSLATEDKPNIAEPVIEVLPPPKPKIVKRAIRVISKKNETPSNRVRKAIKRLEERTDPLLWLLKCRELERLQNASSTSKSSA